VHPGEPSVRRNPDGTADQLAPRGPDEPHPARLAPDHPRFHQIMAAHRRAMDEGREGYPDPDTGLYVLTAATLAGRSFCCVSGCRHCPYAL